MTSLFARCDFVELKPLVRKVDKKLFQTGVSILCLAEVFTIETDVVEDAAAVLVTQFFAVGKFEVGQRNVD